MLRHAQTFGPSPPSLPQTSSEAITLLTGPKKASGIPAAHSVTVVAGIAGQIGRQVGYQLAAQGHIVVGCDRVPLEEINRELRRSASVPCSLIGEVNLADESDARGVIDRTIDLFGRVDGLVVATGDVDRADEDLHVTGWSATRRNLVQNLDPYGTMTEAAVAAALKLTTPLSIAYATSVNGLCGQFVQGGYDLASAAKVQLMRNVATRYGTKGIRVNCAAFGTVVTESKPWHDRLLKYPNILRAIARTTVTGQVVTAAQAAALLVYLVTEHRYPLTGETLVLDGGALMAGGPMRGGDWRRDLTDLFGGPD